MVKVLHIITGLESGGAEMSLFRLLDRGVGEQFEHSVISLKPGGPFEERIRRIGIPVVSINIHSGSLSSIVRGCYSLILQIKRIRPAIVHCWMYHTFVVYTLIKVFLFKFALPVIWGVHSGELDESVLSRRTLLIVRIGALASRIIRPNIVYCGENPRTVHRKLGYRGRSETVIENGVDTKLFVPDSKSKRNLKSQLGIGATYLVVGTVGRYDPCKDYRNFVSAARIIVAQFSEVVFVCCGHGITNSNGDLVSLIKEAGLFESFHLLGNRNDIHEVIAGFDIFVLASASEAFPNVVVEAMSCGVPCVVTDTGDCRYIVGDEARCVASRDSRKLAESILNLVNLKEWERERLGRSLRERVLEKFEFNRTVENYASLYRSVLHM